MALKGKIYSIARQHDDLNTNELFQSMIDESASQDTIVMDGRNIAAGSIFAEQIHSKAITSEKIDTKAITADHLDVGRIDVGELWGKDLILPGENYGGVTINATTGLKMKSTTGVGLNVDLSSSAGFKITDRSGNQLISINPNGEALMQVKELIIGNYRGATAKDIDDIEVGGRNYFVVKDLTPKPYPLVGNDHEYTYNLKPNTTYTISTWNTKGSSFRINGEGVSLSVTGDKGYRVTTDSTGVLRIGLYSSAGETDQFINGPARLKLEEGTIKTDWTPAPEDVEDSYTAVAEAKANLAKTQAEAYADGEITKEEKRAIADAEKKLSEAKTHADTQAGNAETNSKSHADGKAEAAETSAKNYAKQQVDDIDVGGRNLLPQSNNFSEGYWDSGREENKERYSSLRVAGGGTSYGPQITLEGNTQYVYSAYVLFDRDTSISDSTPLHRHFIAKGQTSAQSGLKSSKILSSRTAKANVWNRIEILIETTDSESVLMKTILYGIPTGTTSWWRNFQFEKGNKATDWTPAPEDVEASIADVDEKATNANASISDMMSDLKITPVEKAELSRNWERIKAEYSQLSVQATALGVTSTSYVNAYNALNSTAPRIQTDILVSMTTNYTLTTATRDAFKTQMNTYFTQAEALSKAISDKIQANANTAQTTANTAVTNAGTANTAISDMMSDLKITPIEKTELARSWERIKAEYTQLNSQAASLAVASATRTNYTNAYNALNTNSPRIQTDILASMTTNYNLTTTTRDTFKAQMNAYFVQAETISKAITDKIQANAGSAQETASTASGNANNAKAKTDAWSYNGTTEIDGTSIRTGTLDVNILTGNMANFVTAGFNSISSDLNIDAKGLKITTIDSWDMHLVNSGIQVVNKHGTITGKYSALVSSATREPTAISMLVEPGYNATLSYKGTNTGNTYTSAIVVNGTSGEISLQEDIRITGQVIKMASQTIYPTLSRDDSFSIKSIVGGGINFSVAGGRIFEIEAGNGLKIKNGTGSVDINPTNTTYAHFDTNRSYFLFEKDVRVKGNLMMGTSYNQKVATEAYADSIITRGSSTNGHWIRYDNGTQICWKTTLVTPMDINTVQGNIYSSATISWTFPQSFYSTPVVIPTVWRTGTTGGPAWGAHNNGTLTTSEITDLRMMSSSHLTKGIMQPMAIGRWKA